MTDNVPQPAPPPLEFSRRKAMIGLAALLVLSAGLLTKQIAGAKVASKDACAFYLPLARAWASGDAQHRQHVMIPPLQPAIVGLVARYSGAADENLEFVARCISAAAMLGLVIVVYLIGDMSTFRRVGFAAAALAAANPYLLRYGAAVGPDILYAFALAAMILLLLAYARKQQTAYALAAGLAGSVAGLLRGEGFVMIGLIVAVMALAHWRKGPAQRWRSALHIVMLLAVVGTLWAPRIAYVRSLSGYPVIDLRLLTFLGGMEQTAVQRELRDRPLEIGHIPHEQPPPLQNPDFLQEVIESPLVFGLPTVGAAIFWFIARRRLPRQAVVQVILGIVIAVELLAVSRVKLGGRYLITVVGPMQLWGALGMIELAEALRPWRMFLGRLGRSLAAQTVVLAALVAGMAVWSVSFRNADVEGFDQRQVGQYILNARGEGRRLLCSSPQAPYYARAHYVAVMPVQNPLRSLTAQELRDVLGQYEVDYVAYTSGETWSAWLIAHAAHSPALRRSFPAGPGRTTYLLDARALLEEPALQSVPAEAEGSNRPGPTATSTRTSLAPL